MFFCLSPDCWLSASAPIYLFKVGYRELALVRPTLNKLIEPLGFDNNRVFLWFLLKPILVFRKNLNFPASPEFYSMSLIRASPEARPSPLL